MTLEKDLLNELPQQQGKSNSRIEYDVIVRTHNSIGTIEDMLKSLFCMINTPKQVIVIDNQSTDETVKICRKYGCTIRSYSGREFNYAAALNQGLEIVSSPRCLIISSHVKVLNQRLIELMEGALLTTNSVAGYVNHKSEKASIEIVNRGNFNGKNGLWNLCAYYVSKIARDIKFHEGVPAAEDQYFAKQLYTMNLNTFALHGAHISYDNARYSPKKERNDYIAIAYYVDRALLRYSNISAITKDALTGAIQGNYGLFMHKIKIAIRLLLAKFIEPKFQSRYF